MNTHTTGNRLSGIILLLCALVAIVTATLMSGSAMTQEGALACSVAMILFWLGGVLLLMRRPVFSDLSHTICAMVGLYLCLCLRLCLFDYISPDYVTFLSQWLATMGSMTVPEALSTPIGDYNMPYLYLLLLISRLPDYNLYWIKLASVLADLFLALGVLRLARLLTERPLLLLMAFFGALLAPTVFLNSGYWGQCDGIYAALSLWGLYYGLQKRPILSMALFACAFSFKLQAVFLLPIVLFLLVGGYLRPLHLLAFPATFLGTMLPALVAGRSFSDTFGIYVNQANAYPYLSLNAPSFWSLIPNGFYDYLAPMPVLLAGIVVLLLIYGFLRRYPAPSPADLVVLGYIFSLAIPWLLPKMHERYFYLAEMLSILYVVRYPRRLPVAMIQLGSGFLAYCSYLFGGMGILSNELVAAILGLLLVYLIVSALRLPGGPGSFYPISKEEHYYDKP